MQTLIINDASLDKELAALGLNNNEIKTFSGQKYYFLKLRWLPISISSILKNVTETLNIALVFSSNQNEVKLYTDAVLAGSKESIEQFCLYLCAKTDEAAELGNLISKTIERYETGSIKELLLGNYRLPLKQKTLVMGILNVTPDSFSDGGRYDHIETALAKAFEMAEEGADIIDIGGESTRPGSKAVSAREELNRVIPVIEALKKDSSFKKPVSIDTYKAEVAEQALKAGVEMLNDVWGLKKSETIGRLAARYKVPVCLMHNRENTDYDDLIFDILAELEESISRALKAGIEEDNIIVDPGIGFGKNLEQNLEVMKKLSYFCSLGYPLLLGTSRKSMIGKTLNLAADERIEGTAATVAYGISAGADIVRVHDVKEMHRVAVMTDAMVRR